MSSLSTLLWRNPVLLRELRERVASRRTLFILLAWLVVLSAIVTLTYQISRTSQGFSDPFSGPSVLEMARTGQAMFEWILSFMIALVLFLVPGFTAASIAGERERQTLLPLQVTLLRPVEIVVGKVAASVVFTVLLIVAATPILTFAFVIGGITIGEMLASVAITIFVALVLACITVACSAMVRRVSAGILSAYGLVALMAAGSMILFGVFAMLDSERGHDRVDPPNTILALNPVVALADVSGQTFKFDQNFFSPLSPIGVVREMLYVSADQVAGPADGPWPGAEVDDPVLVAEITRPAPTPSEIDVQAMEAATERIVAGEPSVEFASLPFDGPDLSELSIRQETTASHRVVDRYVPFIVQFLVASSLLSVLAIWLASRKLRRPAAIDR